MTDSDSSEDFEQYARARWRRLQQSALLLGCSPEEAEDLVQTALLRCFRHWEKVCASADMDQELLETYTPGRADDKTR